MTVAEAAISKLLRLPADKQTQVLEYIEALESTASPSSRENLGGLWGDGKLDITEEEIAAARREMWGKVPREDI